MTPAFLRASLEGDRIRASREIGLELPGDWPETPAILAYRLHQLEKDPDLQPWLLRAMALRETGEMAGHIGFHTAPDAEYIQEWQPGAVEFGFTVFPPYRRRGFAREASLAMMQWATSHHGVESFILTIAPENTASQALAADLGFKRIGIHVDDEDGDEDVLLLTV